MTEAKTGARRVVVVEDVVFVQIRQADGTWWNIQSARANSISGRELLATR